MNVHEMSNETLEQYIDELDRDMDLNLRSRRSLTRMSLVLADVEELSLDLGVNRSELVALCNSKHDLLNAEWDTIFEEYKLATAERVDRRLANDYELRPSFVVAS